MPAAVALRGAVPLVGVLLALAGAAHAAPPPKQMEVSVSPPTLSYPSQVQLTYTAEMTAGANPTSFELAWRAPSWGNVLSRNLELGSPIAFGVPQLVGPGTLTPVRTRALSKRHFMVGPCLRGALPDPNRFLAGDYRIDVPPGATTSLVIPATLPAAPRERVAYEVAFAGFLFDPGTFLDPIQIVSAVPAVKVEGVVGSTVEFRFAGKKQRLWQLNGKLPAMRVSTSPPIISRTVRARAIELHRKITQTVTEDDFWSKWSQSLGKYTTDKKGRFILRAQRLPKRRFYRIMVRYDDPGPGLAPDWDCGPDFNTWPHTEDR
jgi:hypothetical protein